MKTILSTGPDGNADGDPNFIGRKIAKLRFQRGWTQEMLVARLQILGCDISRDILANIETKRSVATDKHVFYFAKVFSVDINELYRR